MKISLAEYGERRNQVMQALAVGGRAGAVKEPGVAVIQGAPKDTAHVRFRQYNDMMYLCPIETPHAYLVLDARDDTSHLFLPYHPFDPLAREEPLINAADPEAAQALTGVDAVHGLDDLAPYLARVRELFTPLRAGEGAVQSWDTLQHGQHARTSDPWDGQLDRMQHFVTLLRERLPLATIHDLAPVLNELRLVKSEAEIALLRRAGQLSAQGLIEAMRSTAAGVFEYELDAAMRFIYLQHGALDVSYRAIIGGGDNAWYGHYNANNAPLVDGDLVLVDCGPDYHYYASDITRMWPVGGEYNAVQRQLYGFMVKYHQTLLDLLQPGITAEQVQQDAAAIMKKDVDNTAWLKPIYEQAARRALVFPYHLSHPVGMAVHDVGHYRGSKLRPGLVLTVDPQLIIPEERLYVRVEDTVVIHENGIENFTEAAPLQLDEVETVMRQTSIRERYPRMW